MPGTVMRVRFQIAWALLLAMHVAHAGAPLTLGPADRDWLDSLGPLRFTYDREFAPFESTDAEGAYSGAASSFLGLIGERLGVTFERVEYPTWTAAMDAVRAGEIDLLPCVGRTPEREAYLRFSKPYLEFARVVVTRRDFEYVGLSALADRRIAVQRDSSHHGYLLASTDVSPALYDTFREAMLAVAAGERDALVGNLATVTHVIQNLSLANLKVAGRLGEDTFSLGMAVRGGLERLIPLLDQALASISLKERNAILDHWIPLPQEADAALALTRQEREWLLLNPRIRMGWDPDWAPVEFADDDGRPSGFTADLVREVQSRLGIRFVYEPPRPWPDTLRLLETRRIDIVSCVGFVHGREQFMTLTDAYLRAPVVLYTRKDYPYVRHLGDLAGRSVAVPAEYAEAAWIRRDHPRIDLLPVASVAAGLQAVEDGRADAFAGSVMQGNYYLARMRNWSLGVGGETGYENAMRMGVRSDWPILVGILDKALASISETDKTAFYRKWVWVEYRHRVDSRLILKVGLLGGFGILLFVLWNRRLAHEVRRRTVAEHSATESRARLETSYGELKELERQKDNLTHMIVHDMRNPLTVITGALDIAAEYLREGRAQPDESREAIGMAQHSVDELNHIVDALLDVSRLESGRMPVSPQPGSLHTIATDAVKGLSTVAAKREITVAVRGDAGTCAFDYDLIRRVLANLVSNAITACSGGGSVTVSVREETRTVRVEVGDTGCGIDERYHATIFEKFAQIQDPKVGRRPASSGVGLAFCKLAVENHGGRIGVRSRPGDGSTFWFELPRR